METQRHSSLFWSSPLYGRRRSFPIPNPAVLITAISLILFIIMVFVVPQLLSLLSQAPKPSSVSKSWDSINILLGVFAVLCGLFARRVDENRRHNGTISEINSNVYDFGGSGRMSGWSYPDWKEDDLSHDRVDSVDGSLRSSSSGVPRQEELPESAYNWSKFFDDPEVDFHRRSHEVEKEVAVGGIQADKFVITDSVSPQIQIEGITEPTEVRNDPVQQPPPERSPPPRKQVRRRQSAQNGKNEAESTKNSSQPLLQPEMRSIQLAERCGKFETEKSLKTKETAEGHPLPQKSKNKRKKKLIGAQSSSPPPSVQAQLPMSPPPTPKLPHSLPKKSRKDKLEETFVQNSSPPASALAPPSTPLPPAPPLPTKLLRNPFKKSSKRKRVHSVSTAPRPPIEPPNSIFNNLFKLGGKTKRFQLKSTSSHTAPPPPPPLPPPMLKSLHETRAKSNRHKNTESPAAETLVTHRPSNTSKPPILVNPSSPHIKNKARPISQSPIPSPQTRVKNRETNPVPNGDSVRQRSFNNSPGSEDSETIPAKPNTGDSILPATACRSPDVNTQAESFISKLHGEWRLEKIRSMKAKSRPKLFIEPAQHKA